MAHWWFELCAIGVSEMHRHRSCSEVAEVRRRLWKSPFAAMLIALLTICAGDEQRTAAASQSTAYTTPTAAGSIGVLLADNDPAVTNVVKFAFDTRCSVGLHRGMTGIRPLLLPVRDTCSFEVTSAVCSRLLNETLALFAPGSCPAVDGFMASLAQTLQIPYLSTSFEPPEEDESGFTVSLYPDVLEASAQLMRSWGWRHVVLAYQSNSGLVRCTEIAKRLHLLKISFSFRDLSVHSMRDFFKEAKEMSWNRFFVDADIPISEHFMRVALQEGLVKLNSSFMFGNLDFRLMALDDYVHNFANITGFDVLIQNPQTFGILDSMRNFQSETGLQILESDNTMKAATALAYDAVCTMLSAVDDLSASVHVSSRQLSCDDPDTVLDIGESLFNYLHSVNWTGLTGRVHFDRGRRANSPIDIYQRVESRGYVKIEAWRDGSLYITSHGRPPPTRNETLTVAVILEVPYVTHKQPEDGEKLIGNERYEGFCIDLIDRIAKILGFRYEIVECENCSYGAPDQSGVWNGLVRELIEQRADLGLGSFTMTYQRERVIDFTKPFMHLGISILYKVPKKERPGLFSFMKPLAVETWFCVLVAYMAVSFTMCILGRFSPYEWHSYRKRKADVAPWIKAMPVLNLANSMWFSVGTLMQQGSDVNPRAVSTRIVGAVWWLFSLIVISSYTANLAAFLTVERMVSPIENAEDLAKQSEIEYGTVINGSTMTFFKESTIEYYQKMWSYMSNRPSVFVANHEEGIARVKRGNYALLMESTTLDYRVQRDCDLMQVGGLLDSKGYGIGTPQGSPWANDISMAILQLQERGQIQELYDKWWKKPGTCIREFKAESKAHELGLSNVGGIFLILCGGIVLALVIALAELMWSRGRRRTPGRGESRPSQPAGVGKAADTAAVVATGGGATSSTQQSTVTAAQTGATTHGGSHRSIASAMSRAASLKERMGSDLSPRTPRKNGVTKKLSDMSYEYHVDGDRLRVPSIVYPPVSRAESLSWDDFNDALSFRGGIGSGGGLGGEAFVTFVSASPASNGVAG